MSPAPSIVVVGDVALDVVVSPTGTAAPDSDTPARTVLAGGGAAANVAAWLARAGVTPLLVARVGRDAAGRLQAEELGVAGVELGLAIDDEAPTATIVVLALPDGSRTMYTDRGASLRLTVADVAGVEERAGIEHLHLSGYALLHPGSRAAGRAALAAARRAGWTTSVDASSAAPLAGVGAEAFLDWTGRVDVLRANLAEARVLAPDAVDGVTAARALARRADVAVVSAGVEGAWAARGDEVVHAPAQRRRVVDTVGAGDALTAGFLAAWVRAGRRALGGALGAGVALAAEAVSRPGGRP